ncbi:Gfo/Idh/MocA family oxidoreductase [Escherichia coli]|nr:Gfo/Idh/MocA family oxidoreductase [Escherichia coli]EFG6538696.1 Gfo/Idh/MocA family oxidoreductase [Escherichia coli]EIO3926892.1 Gfo/Idh/MocA family oxidoreductase [Escherichia coli]
MINYGVVGVGYFGAELARFMNMNENAKITCVYDPENGETIAKELNCINMSTLDDLVSSELVDCVIVATPNYLHKEPVIKAAKYKKHVFCEKPISLNYKDCKDMVYACKNAGVTFMAGHIMNFFNGVQYARKLIKDGVIGNVLSCHTKRNGWENKQEHLSWKKIKEQSGGHLYHHIHELDCVQHLLGEKPDTVTMIGGNLAHSGPGFGNEDDMLFMTLEFASGKIATLEWGSAFNWPEHYVIINGTKGSIKIDMQETGGTLRVGGKTENFLVHETQEEDNDRKKGNLTSEMDGAIAYGRPGKKTPLWLASLIKKETLFLHKVLSGEKPDDDYIDLLNGEAAMSAIATADAATVSRTENRKVKMIEITN